MAATSYIVRIAERSTSGDEYPSDEVCYLSEIVYPENAGIDDIDIVVSDDIAAGLHFASLEQAKKLAGAIANDQRTAEVVLV